MTKLTVSEWEASVAKYETREQELTDARAGMLKDSPGHRKYTNELRDVRRALKRNRRHLAIARSAASGKTALEVQADGREAVIATSDARIRGNRVDIIRALRQDLAVIEGGMLRGNGLRLRAAEFAGRALRLSKLIDQEIGGE